VVRPEAEHATAVLVAVEVAVVATAAAVVAAVVVAGTAEAAVAEARVVVEAGGAVNGAASGAASGVANGAVSGAASVRSRATESTATTMPGERTHRSLSLGNIEHSSCDVARRASEAFARPYLADPSRCRIQAASDRT